MDNFQSAISQLDPAQWDDSDLLDKTVSLWEFVCTENERERDLVTEAQWNQWVSYRGERLRELSRATDGYETNGALAESTRTTLIRHMSEIASATRKSRDELLAEQNKTQEIEHKKAQVALETTEKVTGWRRRLGLMLGK